MSREAKEAQDARGNVEHRRLPVPDGLDGERADVGLARMLGVSRTKAAAMASDGLVHADGRPVGRSDHLNSLQKYSPIPPEEFKKTMPDARSATPESDLSPINALL